MSDINQAALSLIENFEGERLTAYDDGNSVDCQIWQGPVGSDGYGTFSHNGKRYRAHRVSLMAKLGRDIFPGMHAMHSCDVRLCVNPKHLSEGTASDNNLHMLEVGRHRGGAGHKEKTHCPSGHPYSGRNLGLNTKSERFCNSCKKADWQRRNEKRSCLSLMRRALHSLKSSKVACLQLMMTGQVSLQ